MPTRLSATLAALGVALLLGGCEIGTAYHDPVARTEPDMRRVIDAYIASGARPVHALSVAAARSQPTLEAAYRSVAPGASFMVAREIQVDGAAGPLTARLYDPTPGQRGEPIILFFHGGLWVTGGGGQDDAAARTLARTAKAKVLSVDYRLAPESPFPAAQDDAVAAYRWLTQHAATFGDPRRIAVAGTGAGATLALDVAIAARDGVARPPVHVLLIDPVANMVERTNAQVLNTSSIPLDRADVDWSRAYLAGRQAVDTDPRLDLTATADLHRLPPVTLITSEMNPLEASDRVLGTKLLASGVDTRQQLFAGATFGFFGMGEAVSRARDAEHYAGDELDGTFTRIGAPPPPRRERDARLRRQPHGHRSVTHRG